MNNITSIKHRLDQLERALPPIERPHRYQSSLTPADLIGAPLVRRMNAEEMRTEIERETGWVNPTEEQVLRVLDRGQKGYR